MLETRSPSCFSSQYILLDRGKPCGRFSGRAFSSSIDVSLLQRYRLVFQHQGFFTSRYNLIDQHSNAVLAKAAYKGIFSTAWNLSLSIGDCQMVSAGFFNQGFYVQQNRQRLAEVNVGSGCSGTWHVRPYTEMPLTDQVMIGLVFHTILQRRRSGNAATSSAGR